MKVYGYKISILYIYYIVDLFAPHLASKQHSRVRVRIPIVRLTLYQMQRHTHQASNHHAQLMYGLEAASGFLFNMQLNMAILMWTIWGDIWFKHTKYGVQYGQKIEKKKR
jgi:hypothetical protein